MNQKKSDKLRGVIAKYATMEGAESKTKQAEWALISRRCYAYRFENPGAFTLDELEKVQRAFKIPWSEISEALA